MIQRYSFLGFFRQFPENYFGQILPGHFHQKLQEDHWCRLPWETTQSSEWRGGERMIAIKIKIFIIKVKSWLSSSKLNHYLQSRCVSCCGTPLAKKSLTLSPSLIIGERKKEKRYHDRIFYFAVVFFSYLSWPCDSASRQVLLLRSAAHHGIGVDHHANLFLYFLYFCICLFAFVFSGLCLCFLHNRPQFSTGSAQMAEKGKKTTMLKIIISLDHKNYIKDDMFVLLNYGPESDWVWEGK